MVDIVIGSVPPIVNNVPQRQKSFSSGVEVRVLNVRQPRKQKVPSSTEHRHKSSGHDPSGSQIITILIPAGHPLPSDIDSDKYRVTMHVTKKNL